MKKLLLAACMLSTALQAGADPPAWIDVHTHFQPVAGRALKPALQSALQAMEERGVQRSLVMPPPFTPQVPAQVVYDIEDLAFAVAAQPSRFALLGGSSLNLLLHATPPDAVDQAVRARFRTRAEQILARGAVGFGEIAALHLSLPIMGSRHPYGEVPPDHPLLLLLADIAAERDVPIDLHCDLVPQAMPLPPQLRSAANPPVLQPNLDALRRLLAHNPRARIVWSHAGAEPLMTRDPALLDELLAAHPNLFVSLRLGRGAPHPAAALDPQGRLKPQWEQLMTAFPDRFMAGTDSFYGAGADTRGNTAQGAGHIRALLEQLPEALAARIGRENAQRVFRLPP